MSLNINLFVI